MTNPKRNENEYNTCTLNFMQFRQLNKRSTPYDTKIHEENTPKHRNINKNFPST